MARNLSASMITAIQAGAVTPFVMVSLETAGGFVRAWNGIGTLVSSVEGSANNYLGVGRLGNIPEITESTDLKAAGIVLELSGIPSDLVSTVLSDVRQNMPCRLFFGLFDSSNVEISSPYEIFSGLSDVAKINNGPETATIKISIENRLIDFEKANTRRYTTEDQAIDDDTDLGFEFVPQLQDAQVIWGRPTP